MGCCAARPHHHRGYAGYTQPAIVVGPTYGSMGPAFRPPPAVIIAPGFGGNMAHHGHHSPHMHHGRGHGHGHHGHHGRH